jgi:uncharacterized protein (TIGR00255 family)
MKSMTGYGRGQIQRGEVKVAVEIQSVNKRQIEFVLNLPSELTVLEAEIRDRISHQVHRGRVSINVTAQGPVTRLQPLLNRDLAKTYLHAFEKLQRELGLGGEITIDLVLHAPGVIETPESRNLDAQTRADVFAALDAGFQQFMAMRTKEGAHLHRDLAKRTKTIRTAIGKIRRLQPLTIKRFRQQLTDRVRKAGVEVELDDERLAKEVVYFAERSDFSEELTRIQSHLSQFEEVCAQPGPIGRTLEFISQEIGRELNTLGAKANDAAISQCVVLCKSEMEKIREQISNIE